MTPCPRPPPTHHRPFCSTANSLLVELDIQTSRADYSHPYLLNDSEVEASESFNSSASVVTSSSTAASRRLLDATANVAVSISGSGSGSSGSSSSSSSSSSSGSASASGSASVSGSGSESGDGKKPRPVFQGGDKPRVPADDSKRMKDERCKMAKLLVSADVAASLNLQTYAYDAADGTVQSNVTVAMAVTSADANKDVETRVLLKFPYFASSLYYDPTVEFQSATTAGYDTTAVSQADNSQGNGAAAVASSALMLVLCMLGALLL